MKVEWKSGAPKEEGFYWFDNGLRIGNWDNPIPSVLVMTKGPKGLFGYMEGDNGGSCPLDMIYSEKCKRAVHAQISPPEGTWQDFSCLEKTKRAWIKYKENGKEHIGFALITDRSNVTVATLLWLQDREFSHGKWLHPTDKYMYYPVAIPPTPHH